MKNLSSAAVVIGALRVNFVKVFFCLNLDTAILNTDITVWQILLATICTFFYCVSSKGCAMIAFMRRLC